MKALLSLCCALPFLLFAQEPKPKGSEEEKKAPPAPVDVLAEAMLANSDKYSKPPTTFRKGHVTPRKHGPVVKADRKGFTIALPAKAPVPTPTIYKGKMYVSGGFKSKEYYCFDANTGKMVWGMDLDDDGPTSAVVEDDIVVFNTESCTIFALNAKDGSHIWSHWLGDPLTSTPAIKDGYVYTSYPSATWSDRKAEKPGRQAEKPKPKPQVSPAQNFLQQNGGRYGGVAQAKPLKHLGRMTHVLACLELKTGKIVWQKWIDSDVMSAPIVIDNEVHITTFAGNYLIFNRRSGQITKAMQMRATAAPLVVDNELFCPQRIDDGKGPAREALAFNDWKGAARLANAKGAAYLDEQVQRGSFYSSKNLALDAANGFSGGAPQIANPAAAKDNVGQMTVSAMQAHQGSRVLNAYNKNFSCMGDELVSTNPKDGSKSWSLKLPGDLKKQGGYLAAPPANAGNRLFVATLKGEVLQVDPDNGTVEKRYAAKHPLRWQPAVDRGNIYVGSQNGHVVCFKTGNASFTGWSTWGANPAHTGINKAVALK